MRRILLTAVASSVLALALPAAASASHSARHHSRAHRRHRAHTVVFVPGKTTSTPGTTPPTMPEVPPSSGEPAGTIASFEGGVLKITLADGSTVTGKVTESTEIECGSDGQVESSGEAGQGDGSGDSGLGDSGPGWQHDGQGQPGGFNGDDEHVGETAEPGCGVSSLLAGAKVNEAELVVSGAGAVWEKIELA